MKAVKNRTLERLEIINKLENKGFLALARVIRKRA